MDESPSSTREKFARFAEQLRKLSFPSSPISVDLARFMADALEDYLAKCQEYDRLICENPESAKSDGVVVRPPLPTLDAAFGLAPKRGRPSDPNRNESIARHIFALRLEGKTWPEIVGIVNDPFGPQRDESDIRKIYRAHRVTLMTEEISRRLNDGGERDACEDGSGGS